MKLDANYQWKPLKGRYGNPAVWFVWGSMEPANLTRYFTANYRSKNGDFGLRCGL